MKQLILVDTCNLLHGMPTFRSRLHEGMDSFAEQLMDQLRPLHDLEHWELHLVVDGKGPRLDQQFVDDLRTLSIIFSADDQSADTVIDSWLMRLGPGWTVRVVSNDRAIIHSAIAQGAEHLSPEALFQWIDRIQKRFSQQQLTKLKKSSSDFGNQLEGYL